jgi:hypothetical protein
MRKERKEKILDCFLSSPKMNVSLRTLTFILAVATRFNRELMKKGRKPKDEERKTSALFFRIIMAYG